MTDPVTAPAHYVNKKILWLQVADDWKLSVRLANTLKYICRYKEKGDPIQDLKKARQYLDMEIERLIHTQSPLRDEEILPCTSCGYVPHPLGSHPETPPC